MNMSHLDTVTCDLLADDAAGDDIFMLENTAVTPNGT